MKNPLFTSASRVAFLIMVLSLCIFTGVGIIDPKDFIALCTWVFWFYFWKPMQNSQDKIDTKVIATEKEGE